MIVLETAESSRTADRAECCPRADEAPVTPTWSGVGALLGAGTYGAAYLVFEKAIGVVQGIRARLP